MDVFPRFIFAEKRGNRLYDIAVCSFNFQELFLYRSNAQVNTDEFSIQEVKVARTIVLHAERIYRETHSHFLAAWLAMFSPI
jgi:hypothetical protein